MSLLLGPVLMFRGLVGNRWNLSVLVVADGDPPVFACATASATSPVEALWALGALSAYRCQFTVTLGSQPQRIAYSVEGISAAFHVPSNGHAPQMAYGSCNGFSSLKAMKGVKDNNRLWRDMDVQHGDAPFHLLLLGGDQVYADSMWETVPAMTEWAELSWDDGNNHVPTQRMKDALLDYYFRLYTSRWSQPEVAVMLAQVPTVAMWDDHDLIDGWGSYPDERQLSRVYREAIWPAAHKAFRTFQQQLADGDEHPGAITPGAGLTFAHQVGCVAILALDLRTERSDQQVLGAANWDLIYAWIDALQGCRHLIIMSSIPVVYPVSTCWSGYWASCPAIRTSRTTSGIIGGRGRTRASACE